MVNMWSFHKGMWYALIRLTALSPGTNNTSMPLAEASNAGALFPVRRTPLLLSTARFIISSITVALVAFSRLRAK